MGKLPDPINTPRRMVEKLSAEINKLKDRIQDYQDKIKSLNSSLKYAQKSKEKQKAQYEEKLAMKDAIIKELENQLAHEKALNSSNGTNAGIPTSQTPYNEKKVIPNSRRSTGKSRGGQKGHAKSEMPPFNEDEITETVEHGFNTEDKHCDFCGGNLIDTGEVISKDEFDIKVIAVKRRHQYHEYQCEECGKTMHVPIDKSLKEKNQYGSQAQATALSLMATGNVAINKVKLLLNGFTGGLMNMSEGYICKLMARASVALIGFREGLKKVMIQRTLLYWDDTVIFINGERACMRFYGDERISYYTAHMKKDLDSLLEDDILTVLKKETNVMHDHNTVNYNKLFSFGNLECNQHLQRDLQRSADDNPSHTWARDLKKLISDTIGERKELIDSGVYGFPESHCEEFHVRLDELLDKGLEEEAISTNKASVTSESTLVTRIRKHRDNYFTWLNDFSLPTTDNLSERGLRPIKSHMKISGQFLSEKTASRYATVKTYVETCRKNGINEMIALSRLCAGNPYTISEIFSQPPDS